MAEQRRKVVVPLPDGDDAVRFIEELSVRILVIAIEEIFSRERSYDRMVSELGLPHSIAAPISDTIRMWSLRKTMYPRVPVTIRPGTFASFTYTPDWVVVDIRGAPVPLRIPFQAGGLALTRIVVWWAREEGKLKPYATLHTIPLKAEGDVLNSEAYALAVHAAIILAKHSPYCRDRDSLAQVLHTLTGARHEVCREIAVIAIRRRERYAGRRDKRVSQEATSNGGQNPEDV